MSIYVCVCVCVCVRERERERASNYENVFLKTSKCSTTDQENIVALLRLDTNCRRHMKDIENNEFTKRGKVRHVIKEKYLSIYCYYKSNTWSKKNTTQFIIIIISQTRDQRKIPLNLSLL